MGRTKNPKPKRITTANDPEEPPPPPPPPHQRMVEVAVGPNRTIAVHIPQQKSRKKRKRIVIEEEEAVDIDIEPVLSQEVSREPNGAFRIATRQTEIARVSILLRKLVLPSHCKIEFDQCDVQTYWMATSEGIIALLDACSEVDQCVASLASTKEDGTMAFQLDVNKEKIGCLSIFLTEKAIECCSPGLLRMGSTRRAKKYAPSQRIRAALAILFPLTILAEAIAKQKDAKDITAKMVYDVVDNVQLDNYERNENGVAQKPMYIPGLVPKLRPYQEAAVRWMLRRERGDDPSKEWELAWVMIKDGLVAPLSDSPDGAIICCPFSGWLVTSYEQARNASHGVVNTVVRGGLLAESMGLGKTVEVISCILANTQQSSVPDPFATATATPDSDSTEDQNGCVSPPVTPKKAPRTKEVVKHNWRGICMCGIDGSFHGSLTYVVCSSCREPMHGLCAGFESIEELVAETTIQEEDSPQGAIRVCSSLRCPSCCLHAKRLIPSRATLIITPAAILTQWEREIRRHTSIKAIGEKRGFVAAVTPEGGKEQNMRRPLKVVVYPGIRSLFKFRKPVAPSERPQCHLIHPHLLADADIVLMTFDALMSDLGHSDENPFVSEGEDRLRGKKRYRVIPSPLTSIRWWRICLDEAQRVETPTAISARMALKLEANYRWCVSGTPVQRGKLEDLYGLLLFLRLSPFSSKAWFKACLQHDSTVMDRVQRLLCNIMWRSTKANEKVRKQMGVPPQEEKKVVLRFSSIEKHFYDVQLERTMLAVTEYNESKTKKRMATAKIDQLKNQLHRLRAACCHPQVGSSGIGKASKKGKLIGSNGSVSLSTGVLTMDQILDRLIDDARQKCEESQRLAVMHTNAMASLSRLKVEAKQFGASFEESDEALLNRSCELYRESLDIGETNAKPSPTIGEAVLTGSSGFLLPHKVIRNGKSILPWLIRAESFHGSPHDSIPDLCARFDFEAMPKKICEIRVKPLVDIPVALKEGDTQEWAVVCPKEVVLQVAHSALGGQFVDVVRFSFQENGATEDILTFGSFRTNKSKSWRIVVKSCYNCSNKSTADTLKFFVGLQADLFEPDVASDSLQRLHVLHNYALTMTSLRQLQLQLQGPVDSNDAILPLVEHQIEAMEDECRKIETLYLDGARALHSGIMLDLDQCGLSRREKANDLACAFSKGKKTSTTVDMWQDGWWDDILAGVFLNGHPHERLQLCERVSIDLENFEQSYKGQAYKSKHPRKVLSRFHDVDGLRTALSLRLQDIVLAHTKCMDKFSNLSSHPSEAEQIMNSQCGKCKSDWNQTGPVCSHCTLEEELLKSEMDDLVLCILSSLHKWLKDNKPNGRVGNLRSIANIDGRANKFFECVKAREKEWQCAKKVWRIHSDLLNDIDEANQCKRSMRLAREDEDLTALTEDELNAIVVPVDIPTRMMDHGAKQAMALGNLRRNIQTLRYLKNQTKERQGGSNSQTLSGEAEKCMMCLSTMEKERAVLSCGHSFHKACLDSWTGMKRGQILIACPVRCSVKTKKDEVMFASDKRKDDGSPKTRDIQGSWGTKVTRLLCDLMDVSDRGEKSIVFSQYEDLLWVVEQALLANKVGYARAKGMKRIGEMIKRFRSHECTVLLLNVKQGAEGLTLVEANHIFMVEPLLNCGLDKQAISRIHRIGQTAKTFVHRYLVEDTVEIKIDKLRIERQEDQLEDSLNEGRKKHEIEGGGIDGGFSQEELQKLLS